MTTLAAAADDEIEASAQCLDAILPGFGVGDMCRNIWRDLKELLSPPPPPACDCPMDPHHRWNCALTPLWVDTMRALDMNPWTVGR